MKYLLEFIVAPVVFSYIMGRRASSVPGIFNVIPILITLVVVFFFLEICNGL